MNMRKNIFWKVIIFVLIIINLPFSKSNASDYFTFTSLTLDKARELNNIKPINYQIDLRVDEKNNLDFQVKLNFICKEDKAKKIKFFIGEKIELKEIRLKGKKIRFGTAVLAGGFINTVRCILDEPLRKDEIYELTLIYSYKSPQDKKIIHLKGDDFWFPCSYPPEEFFKVHFNITVPKNYIPITSGELKEVEEGKEFKNYTYEIEKTAFLLFTCGEFNVKSKKFKGVNIEVYYPKELENLKRIEDTLLVSKEIINLYEKNFSLKYPSRQLRCIFICRKEEFSLYSSELPAYTYGDVIVFNKSSLFANEDIFYTTLAHEIAHRWFGTECGGKLKSGAGTLFLTEGLATYLSVSLYYEKWRELIREKYGRRLTLKQYLEGVNKFKCLLPVSKYDVMVDECAAFSLNKSILLLRMLSYLIGEKDWRKILNLYVSENSYKFPTMEDFKNAVKEVVGNKLDWFFDVFIESNQAFDIAISDKILTSKEKDYWTTTFNINKNIDTVKIENYKVLFIGKKSSYQKNINLIHTNHTFTFKTNDEIVAVYLDPDFYIFDTNPDNNFRSKGIEDLNKALEEYDLGKYDKSLKFFKDALKKDPYIFTFYYQEIKEAILLNKETGGLEKLLENLSEYKYLLPYIESIKSWEDKNEGFIKSWAIYKPERQDNDFDKEEIEQIKKSDIIKPYEDNTYGIFKFGNIFPKRKNYIVYTLLSIHSDDEKEGYIEFGSDAKAKIYFNNKSIFLKKSAGKEDKMNIVIIPIKLKKGQNRIVIKFHIKEESDSFVFKLLDKNYEPLKDVIYSTK